MGVFEQVDVLVPVLYLGSEDSHPDTAAASAKQRLELTSQIHKQGSPPLTMVAITHWTYFGGPLTNRARRQLGRVFAALGRKQFDGPCNARDRAVNRSELPAHASSTRPRVDD